MKTIKSKYAMNASLLRGSGRSNRVDTDDKLAICLSCYRGNGTFGKDYENAAWYLNFALRAGEVKQIIILRNYINRDWVLNGVISQRCVILSREFSLMI